MLVDTVRRPGAKGTRKLVEQHGNYLIAYVTAPVQCRRNKTAELIIEKPVAPLARIRICLSLSLVCARALPVGKGTVGSNLS